MQRFRQIDGFTEFLRTLPKSMKSQLMAEIRALGDGANVRVVKRLMAKYKSKLVERRGKFAQKQKAPHRSTTKRGHELDREVQDADD